MVYLGPKLCVTGADLQAALEKGESGLLETELFGDHDEKHNAQKSEEDEIAIKNNDVVELDGQINKVKTMKGVVNVSEPKAELEAEESISTETWPTVDRNPLQMQ